MVAGGNAMIGMCGFVFLSEIAKNTEFVKKKVNLFNELLNFLHARDHSKCALSIGDSCFFFLNRPIMIIFKRLKNIFKMRQLSVKIK